MAPADDSLEIEDPLVAEGLVPAEFDLHTVLLLVRPTEQPDLSEEQLDRLQVEHLRFRKARREEGLLVAYGPLRDQTDPRVRGVSIWAAPLSEAIELSERDPIVVAGWYAVEGGTWNVARGSVRFGRDGAAHGHPPPLGRRPVSIRGRPVRR